MILIPRCLRRGSSLPRITGGRELIDLYNPSRRKRLGIKINWHFLHITAHNIASIVETLHEQGIVLGDIKPQNILVNNQAIPAIIDTDSFQVKNPVTGSIYRCLVGSEGFTPPELLGLDFSLITQTPLHDRFRLGVVIYYLLFGSHPFQGHWSGRGDPPEQHELIKQGQWVFSPESLVKPSKLTIPLKIIHPALQHCFWRCFQAGHSNPSQRPSAREWQEVLAEAATALKQCSAVKSHVFNAQESSCYWCDRQARLKVDIFDHAVVPATTPQISQPSLPSPVMGATPIAPTLPVPFPLTGPSGYQVIYRYRLSHYPALLLLLGGGAIAGWILSAWFLATKQSPRLPITQQSFAPVIESRLLSEPQVVPTPPTAQEFLKTGYGNYLQSDYVQALTDLTQALVINPNLAEAYYYRSLVKRTLGYGQEAELDWQVAQRLAPEQMPFNPMFTSLDLALPLDDIGQKKYLNTNEVKPIAKPSFVDQSLPPVSPRPVSLPSPPISSTEEHFLELQIEQINQDILRLRTEINREPNTIPLEKPGDLPQP